MSAHARWAARSIHRRPAGGSDVVELDDDAGADDRRLADERRPPGLVVGHRADEEPRAGRAPHRLLPAPHAVLAGDGDERGRRRLVAVVELDELGADRQVRVRRRVAGQRPHHGRVDDDDVGRPRAVLDDVDERGARAAGRPGRRPARRRDRRGTPGRAGAAVARRRDVVAVEVGDETLAAGVGLDGRGDGEHLGVVGAEAGVVDEHARTASARRAPSRNAAVPRPRRPRSSPARRSGRPPVRARPRRAQQHVGERPPCARRAGAAVAGRGASLERATPPVKQSERVVDSLDVAPSGSRAPAASLSPRGAPSPGT